MDPHLQCDYCQSSLCNEQNDLHEQVVTAVHELMINGAERHEPQEGTLLVQTRALAADHSSSEPPGDQVTEEDINPRPAKIRKISEPKVGKSKIDNSKPTMGPTAPCKSKDVKASSFANSPKPDPLSEGVGHQDVKVPSTYEKVTDLEGYPKGLLVYKDNKSSIIIPVPKEQRARLIL